MLTRVLMWLLGKPREREAGLSTEIDHGGLWPWTLEPHGVYQLLGCDCGSLVVAALRAGVQGCMAGWAQVPSPLQTWRVDSGAALD